MYLENVSYWKLVISKIYFEEMIYIQLQDLSNAIFYSLGYYYYIYNLLNMLLGIVIKQINLNWIEMVYFIEGKWNVE